MNANIAILQFIALRRRLTDEEWEAVDRIVGDSLPAFHEFMAVCKEAVGIAGYRVCLLLRLSVRGKDIAQMLGVRPPYVSKLSAKVLLRLWGETGSGKMLRSRLAGE